MTTKILTRIHTAQDLYEELERILQTAGTLNVPLFCNAEELYDISTAQSNIQGGELYEIQINLIKKQNQP